MSKARDLADVPAGGGDLNVDSGTLFVDASENRVGIGTSSPTTELHISSSQVDIRLEDNSGTSNYADLTYTDGRLILASDKGNSVGSSTIEFKVDNTERMRIDSSGNLLVGTTTTAVLTNDGIRLNPVGLIDEGITDNMAARLSRNGTDGDIIQFYKNASTVGSIGYQSYGFQIQGESVHSGISFGGDSWVPLENGVRSDNQTDLGTASYRFDDLYATNGSIQTSDANEKQDIEELSEAEQRVAVAAKALMRKFRWKDAVAEKGDDARIHFGIIAQDLQAAFEAEGLDAGRYAMFISSTWWETQTEVPAVEAQDAVYETQTDDEGNEVQVLVSEAVEAKEAYTRTDTYDTEAEAPEGAVERTRLGVRYSELLAFIIAAI